MKSKKNGKNTSALKIESISKTGFSLFLDNKKYLLNFTEYPWFKNASGEEILNVKLLNSHHLYWESLDIDLELDSIKNPASYPLAFKSTI